MSDIEISQYPGTIPEPDLADVEVIARFAQNTAGRDFVVGDLHGMFGHLTALLREIDFCEDTDRLFSVGDLVDRGPSSHEALSWLKQPWFAACRGNHEQFAIDSEDPEQLELWINYNGGEWWLDLSETEQQQWRDSFRQLPLAMEIQTSNGLIGVVHADVPPLLTWERFTSLLELGDHDALFYAIWSRVRLQENNTAPVEGLVERVYCGHTPTRQPVRMGNLHYIDTGAVYSRDGYEEARLTVIEIHPGPYTQHHVYTDKKV
jgi:serine/threonine protein phosphatase 1